jgi:hypothetical protein
VSELSSRKREAAETNTRTTRYFISARQYWIRIERPGMRYDHEHIEGVAELVRAEHRSPHLDEQRISQAIYWWPQHEGREWPSRVFFVADDWGDPSDRDPWGYLHECLGLADGTRWVELQGYEYVLVHRDVDETEPRRLPRGQAEGT